MRAKASEQERTEFVHRILLVEDQPRLAEWVKSTLEEHPDMEVSVCDAALDAVAQARALGPSLIVQDLVMPHLDGFALLERYRRDAALAEVPVVVLSAVADVEEKSRAFELGAIDYLVKVPHPLELVARVRAHSRAYLLRRDREHLTAALRASMTQLAENNARLTRVAREDALTGLSNRRGFDEALDDEWNRGARTRAPLSFALVDIDHFKRYNDRYGHVRGDECLRRVAAVVGQCARRSTDLATRYGGEEFGLLLPNTPPEGARLVAERVRAGIAALELPHEGRGDGKSTLSVTVGVATLIPSQGDQRWVVVESADAALYQAKRRGRDRVLHASLDR